MGVKRLWTFLQENEKDIVQKVDLVPIAKFYENRLKLLVDFDNFVYPLMHMFWDALHNLTGNHALALCGGEYDLLDTFLKNYIEALRSVNIEMVFYFDGGKGSSEVDTQQKMQTWESRHYQNQKRLVETFENIKGRQGDLYIFPAPFHFEKIKKTLQEADVNMVNSCSLGLNNALTSWPHR